MSRVLTCQGLVKRFGERAAVDDVGFHIDEGETYGLLGPNGAGKTTTINLVCGLLARDAGAITLLDEELDGHHVELRSRIGLVPQEIALYPDLTGRENLRFFGKLQGLRGSPLAERVGEALEIVGLADRADDKVDDYSGGMKRRCNIAAGLLHRPRLLILDEPTVGVDPQSRNAILESIEELGGGGLSVLYTTHYMEEAERLCDRVGIMDQGRLIAEGTRRELIDHVEERTRIRVSVAGGSAELVDRLQGLDGVQSASARDGAVDVLVSDASGLLAPVIELADALDIAVTSVEVQEPDLEAVFLHLTGKALRD